MPVPQFTDLSRLTLPIMAACMLFAARATQAEPPTQAKQEIVHSGIETKALASKRPQFLSTPLHFEANTGQTDQSVRFLSRGPGYSLFLTNNQAVFSLRQAAKNKDTKPAAVVLKMQLAGANPTPAVTGKERLPGKVNYFLGNDPKKWKTNLATFGKVAYNSVYPGIDLVYYGNQNQLEYDFIVAPGADPKQIALSFTGAKSARVAKSGDLVLGLSGGSVRWQKPVVYQEAQGKKVAVAGKYVLGQAGQSVKVGFQVARYDRTKPLVIDPIMRYSTYLGGSEGDYGNAIALDSSGNVYIAGRSDLDFPTTAGSYRVTPMGAPDAFIAKFSPTGARIYATYLGGSNAGESDQPDEAFGIAVDTAGNAYVTGHTGSTDFPTTAGAPQTAFGAGGQLDAFITKLNAAGSALVYSTYLGGGKPNGALETGDDDGFAIAVNTAGEAYVTGTVDAPNFPTTAGAFQTVPARFDAFVTKINAAGTAWVFSTILRGTAGSDSGEAILLDPDGNVWVTGRTGSSTFPVTAGAYQTTRSAAADCFVAKFNPTGSAILYATYLGGSQFDVAFGLGLDKDGNVYVGGRTQSLNFPTTPSSAQPSYGGGFSDGFVSKFNPTLSTLLYSTYLGGAGDDSVLGLGVTAARNVVVVGDTSSETGFPITPNATQPEYGGAATDAFLAKLSADGSEWVFATYLGGLSDDVRFGDVGYNMKLDPVGNAYIVGYTFSSDFPTTATALQTENGGTFDAFLAYLQLVDARFDFNSNNMGDILFQNPANGQVSVWLMNGIVRVGAQYLTGGLSAGWKAVGANDYNGDGKTDLVLQNQTTGAVTVWFYNGTTRIGTDYLAASVASGWRVVGTGDLNGDGKADLVFQNQNTGFITCWFYDGTNQIGAAYIYPTPAFGSTRISTDWKVVTMGDYNGDGQLDLIFQNSVTGGISCWFLDGIKQVGGVYIKTSADLNWPLVGSGDYNKDGKADLLFQNITTGVLSVWYMNGTTIAGSAYLTAKPGASWKVSGLR